MPASTTPRFCPQCGGARSPAAHFCEHCGTRLAADETASSAAPESPAAARRAEVEALLRRGDLDRAEAALDAALADAPDDPDLLALRAHAALERLDVHYARELIDRAIAIAPGSAFARLQLADYWLRLGVTPRAREELERALALCGDDEALEVHVRRSLALLRSHTRSEFGGAATDAGFAPLVRVVARLFQSKRTRRRRDAWAAASQAAAEERGA